MTRILALRALHLSGGAIAHVVVHNELLCHDMLYTAALELKEGKLDVMVRRENEYIHVSNTTLPVCLYMLIDTKDGGVSSYGVTGPDRREPVSYVSGSGSNANFSP